MTNFRLARLDGGRPPVRLPLSPLKAEMAEKALKSWREPEAEGRERRWFRIEKQDDAAVTQVNIFDEISWWGISAQELVDELAGISGAVEVHINSPGGDAFDGITIYNALAARDGVTTVVDGLAASAASVIAMAGQKRVMSPGSMMMIHDALALCIGNAADMRETAVLLDKVSDNIASIYAAHTSAPLADWRKAMVAEGWYTAQEAVDAGLAHEVAARPGSGAADGDPAAKFDRSLSDGWQQPASAGAGEGSGSSDNHIDPRALAALQEA
jgi:ATP-dependent protease ClpP protease subunit